MFEIGAIIARSWQDNTVSAYSEDCMLPVSPGVYFHHRIQCFIVIKAELPNAVANALPISEG